MESKTSSQTKARMIVLAIFVIGFAAGALSMNLYERFSSKGPDKDGPPHGPTYLLTKMDNKLDLSEEQKREIGAILEETSEKYIEIRRDLQPRVKEYEPRFDAVRQQSRERIRAVLKPNQLSKYEEMVQESDRRREEMNEKLKK
ncbi:MAG TPA: hypothetical protein VF131_20510 [Blastocatellia bacterium]|nr:hypothetical protein [Blastocatellia bacterium]